MKLLITATTYPRFKGDTIPGFVHDFASKLAERDDIEEVHVLVPHAKGIPTYELTDGVHIHRYRYWWPASGESITYGGAVKRIKKSPLYVCKLLSLLFFQLVATIRIVVRHKIDIVNAHWLIPIGFVAVIVKFLTRCKVVITIHGGDVFSLRSGIFAKFKSWSLKHADVVVVNSTATRMEAEHLYSDKDYPIIPMGVDVDAIRPHKKTPRGKHKPLRLLFVGRLVKEKGVIYLLEAVVLLAKKGQVVNLTVVGSGTEESILKEKVGTLGIENNVTFRGWIDHEKFPELFAETDIFIGPSIVADNGWQEAFGLVFAESLALNTPVIGTNTGGIADIVKDGKNGLLVPQRDSKALAAAIQKFIDEPELVKKLANGAREDITRQFSWSSTIDGYVQLFRDLEKRRF